jgi:hypothetical protein
MKGYFDLDHSLTMAGIEQSLSLRGEWRDFCASENSSGTEAKDDKFCNGTAGDMDGGSFDLLTGPTTATEEATQIIKDVSGLSHNTPTASPFSLPASLAKMLSPLGGVSTGPNVPPISPRYSCMNAVEEMPGDYSEVEGVSSHFGKLISTKPPRGCSSHNSSFQSLPCHGSSNDLESYDMVNGNHTYAANTEYSEGSSSVPRFNSANNSSSSSETSTPFNRSRSATSETPAGMIPDIFPHVIDFNTSAYREYANDKEDGIATERYDTGNDGLSALGSTFWRTSSVNKLVASIPQLQLKQMFNRRSDSLGSDDSTSNSVSCTTVDNMSLPCDVSARSDGSFATVGYTCAVYAATGGGSCADAVGNMHGSLHAPDCPSTENCGSDSRDSVLDDTSAAGQNALTDCSCEPTVTSDEVEDEDADGDLLAASSGVVIPGTSSACSMSSLTELRARMLELRQQFMLSSRIYASPLTRAVETAVVALHGHPAMVANGLTLLR